MSKPGWLKAQIDDAKEEIRHWPQWLRQARGLESLDDAHPKQPEEGSKKEIPGNEPQSLGA